ncbi:MAG: DNA cytosine methyltransferase [Pirellulaceae bacterium]
MQEKITRLSVLELFAGIGGCAAALGSAADIVAAVDIHVEALAVYRANLQHPTYARTIESVPDRWLASCEADLWWLSPPCQPFTVRGRQRDVDDPRCQALLRIIDAIGVVRPRYIALENVPGFECSRAHARLCSQLDRAGYNIRSKLLCPTELGIPNRRRRYYLLAARDKLCDWPAVATAPEPFRMADILECDVPAEYDVPAEQLVAYRGALHRVDVTDRGAISNCFTAGYGRSMVRSGSYLQHGDRCRRFTPAEILRLLAFPDSFRFPTGASPRTAWPLVGNSLSVAAVRHVLSAIPELAPCVAMMH